LASEFRELDSTEQGRKTLFEKHSARQLCSLFYEPSTRTRLSFETAALKLGMGVVSTENARDFSSASKGEILEDTIRVLDEYNFDAIVLRHHETGSAAQAASVSSTPIINAGDGKGEHPTQSLLDMMTIFESHGRCDNLKIVIGGDLKHGRTARSLALMLSKFDGNQITFISNNELQIGDDILSALKDNNVKFQKTSDMTKPFIDADVVYWTRLQTERLDGLEASIDNFTITTDIADSTPDGCIIMHPLPRVSEIHQDVDANHRAKYFRQAGNGLYMRMALLDSIFIANPLI
jgi:aspartate carbamoyltransferase catalytic subunit